MENVKTIPEIVTTEECEQIISRLTPYARIRYIDYDDIHDQFESSILTGFCFCGEPVTSISRVAPSDDLYPGSNTGCYNTESKEDFNHYIITTNTEAFIRVPAWGELPHGISEIRHDYFIRSRKLMSVSIDAEHEDFVTVFIYIDDFLDSFEIETDVKPCIECSVSISRAAEDYKGVMAELHDEIFSLFKIRCGEEIGLCTEYYLNKVYNDAKEAVISKLADHNK